MEAFLLERLTTKVSKVKVQTIYCHQQETLIRHQQET